MRKIDGLDCILLVDDDEATNFLNTRAIRKSDLNVEVQVATNGQEALDYITQSGKFAAGRPTCHPNLIFLDLNMPGMDGWEFLEEYQKLPEELTVNTKILVLTTSLNPDEERRANDIQEVKGFINKPLTPEKLEKVIKIYVF